MRLAYFFAAMAFMAGPALAADTAVVPTQGLDMGDKAQVAKLHQAVLKTAETLCKNGGMPGRGLRDCIKDTTDAAIKGNPSPELKAYHASLNPVTRYTLASFSN